MYIWGPDFKKVNICSRNQTSMPQIVYHYCSLQTFLSIISNSTIRLTNIAKSNDLEEITYITPYLRQAICSILDDFNVRLGTNYRVDNNIIDLIIDYNFNELSKNFYVSCFSEAEDTLDQWTRYADDARGIAIGFDTYEFVKLQITPYTGFVFGKIIYGGNIIRDNIKDMLQYIINQKWIKDDDQYNQNLVIDTISSMTSTILYYSVLYKNPAFINEREWRIIYNPFGRIKRITDINLFYDRIQETEQALASDSGFIRNPISFTAGKHGITSYIDLDFSRVKLNLIKEVIIGPASKVSCMDKDLLLFMKTNGYTPSYLGIEETVRLSKSSTPYI